MSQVRTAAVAGQFYPGDRTRLQREVEALLNAARTDAPCPKALIAPHAGYIYSGSVAARGYARVRNGADRISRVVLLGPSHRVGFRGIATTGADRYATPLGQIPLDKAAIRIAESLPGVVRMDEAHAREHSLEVHLPFLQRCLDDFLLAPMVVGQAEPEPVAALIDALWGGPETLVVVSSDLSHYLPYEEARGKDAATAALIEGRATDISPDRACGCKPLNGLMQVLRRRGLGVETVQVLNSGDTAGGPDRVVGYGTWVVEETASATDGELAEGRLLSPAQRRQLLALARNTILHGLTGGGEPEISLDRYHPALRAERGSFVTIDKRGQLRGCIGSLSARRPLVVDVAHNARAAAFRDERFEPLRMSEFADVELHISVLGPTRAMAVGSRDELVRGLRPGVDGLILQQGRHRSTYLPSVWEKIPRPESFVSELRAKAGLPRQGWSDDMRVWTYTTEEF